jgi:hypothetical protein
MTDPSNPKSEAEVWNELVQAQRKYAQSLASLDSLIFESPATNPLPLQRQLIEEVAMVRRAAYSRYREAMHELSERLRKSTS